MTIQDLLSKFDAEIYADLEADEDIGDLKMAAAIVIEERMAYRDAVEPKRDDAIVALWSWTPLRHPLKKPEHYYKAKRLRRKNKGIAKDKAKQKQLRSAITDALRRATPAKLGMLSFDDFFRTDEGSMGRKPTIGETE